MSSSRSRARRWRTVSSITESVRNPRKSIFSRPNASTPIMSNCVTTRFESSRESFESFSGR